MHRERPAYRKVCGPFFLGPSNPAQDPAPLQFLTLPRPALPAEPKCVPAEPAFTIVYQPIVGIARQQVVGHAALAAALIRFARDTGSKILAEGVETRAELEVLRELKVAKAQGFLLGRPLPIGEH
jgi:EAL domain-containing protein (putative c-di-GMP-specific phosphodiesterase class I)